MRKTKLNQACLTAAQIITIAVCLITPAYSQTTNPPPPPQTGTSEPAPDSGPNGSPPPREYNGVYFGEGDPRASFSEALNGLTERAYKLLPAVQREIEGKLLPWLEDVSKLLAFAVILGAFAKMWRENGGAGVDLFWWFARLGVVLALFGSGPKIIQGMYLEGKDLAAGADGGGALLQFYLKQQYDFDESYTKFTEGMFTIGGTSVKSVPGGLLGALLSNEASDPDPIRNLDGISKDMPVLYDSLNFSRGVISFGDLFLLLLGNFLLIVMRLAAPVMIALAIDRSLAQRVTYPFVWGVVVLTLIWPIVVLVIKSIAYMGGNIAMGLGDGTEFNTFDENTMRIIQQGDPFYTALFASAIMLISGLCLWASPYIAYQLSVGRVYEGVSQTISSWVGQLAGMGIGYYSASMGAAIQRRADEMQAGAQFAGEGIRAEAAQKSGQKFADATRRLGIEQTLANADFQKESFGASKTYQDSMAGLQFEVAKGNNTATWAKESKEVGISTDQQIEGLKGGMYGTMVTATGGAVNQILSQASYMSGPGGLPIPGMSSGAGMPSIPGMPPIPGMPSGAGMPSIPGVGGRFGLGAAGAIIGAETQVLGNLIQTKYQADALNVATPARYQALDDWKQLMDLTQANYAAGVWVANKENKETLVRATNASADRVVGGYNSAYQLTLEGNKINYRGAIDAAREVRNAAMEAARLRAVATVVNSVGSNAARLMDGLTPRY